MGESFTSSCLAIQETSTVVAEKRGLNQSANRSRINLIVVAIWTKDFIIIKVSARYRYMTIRGVHLNAPLPLLIVQSRSASYLDSNILAVEILLNLAVLVHCWTCREASCDQLVKLPQSDQLESQVTMTTRARGLKSTFSFDLTWLMLL